MYGVNFGNIDRSVWRRLCQQGQKSRGNFDGRPILMKNRSVKIKYGTAGHGEEEFLVFVLL